MRGAADHREPFAPGVAASPAHQARHPPVGFGDAGLGQPPARDRLLDGVDRRAQPVLAVAEEQQVAAGGERQDGGLAGAPLVGDRAHLEVVAGDDAAKAEAPAQQAR